jgi:hypothetical protein
MLSPLFPVHVPAVLTGKRKIIHPVSVHPADISRAFGIKQIAPGSLVHGMIGFPDLVDREY